MALSRRSTISIGAFGLLALFVLIGWWYESRHAAPGQAANVATVNVTNGGDRGPGTLREALFIAAAANTETTISVRVPKITLATALPPLASSRGMHLVVETPGAQIDASALPNGAVLDVAGANVSITGLHILNCKGAGVLLRAEHFKLEATTVESCDVGVDVAENANQVLIERNRFHANRIGIRFAASNRNTTVVKNDFSEQRDAGIWAVRAESDPRASISIRDNRFTKERIGVFAANISLAVERNELLDTRETAIQVMGAGTVLRANRVSGGAGMGIIAENARGISVESNELDGLAAYGIMVKNSADVLLRGNRVHNSGYGLAFVTGSSPSTAIDNTIIEPKYNGIDVIGDSPILRNNHVVRPRALALKVIDFDSGNGRKTRSKPFLEGNNFDASGTIIAGNTPSPNRVPQ